jgi:hypothetical protein
MLEPGTIATADSDTITTWADRHILMRRGLATIIGDQLGKLI